MKVYSNFDNPIDIMEKAIFYVFVSIFLSHLVIAWLEVQIQIYRWIAISGLGPERGGR